LAREPGSGPGAIRLSEPDGRRAWTLSVLGMTDEPSKPIRYVKGVGQRYEEIFHRLGVRTAQDLLYHFPRRYEDRRRFVRIAEMQPGDVGALRGKVLSVENVRPRGRNMEITKVALDDGSGVILLTWFNQPYLKKTFAKLRGKEIVAYGKCMPYQFEKNLVDIEWEPLDGDADPLQTGRIVPVYPLTEGLSQRIVRRAVRHAIEDVGGLVDPIPPAIRKRWKLAGLAQALRSIHFPDDDEALKQARIRLIFEELFLLQLYFALSRHAARDGVAGIAFEIDRLRLERRIREELPFELTESQGKVLEEILADMASPHPMNRLLQGDVGSGKTIVALLAIAVAVDAGCQAALMAPTEVLAEQHYLGSRRMLERLGIRTAFLVGKLSAKERREARQALADGAADLAIGTHALIQEGVEFRKLGLVIIDEQHRFGVLQRAKLREMGAAPDVLVMTATPIPRTLAMAIHGDLDVSTIDEMPPGRIPVKTYVVTEAQRERAYEMTRKLLRERRQAFVVCPLVDVSEKLVAAASVEVYERLRREVFSEFEVGLLHGQMPSKEKEEAMERFRRREIDVLASTTVIEVGVDVPNATVMLIENAERFGLSQLHQLRGRVGRGTEQSYCIMISDARGEEAQRRLEAMERTTDGFKIAEYDLEIRGPGEVAGTRQSGLPQFKLANIVRDRRITKAAREAATAIIKEDPGLSRPPHAALRRRLETDYESLSLATVS
jgi:ATP-dependent DNA helicase RecG